VRLIASDGMQLVALGVVTGLVAAVALARALRSLLYGVTSHDPATMLAVPALLALVALVACLVPARRASRIDPLVALRQE
jgi:putative ABC transport system permease protein